MAVTFTIKQVPERLARRIRARAAANRRSLQQELLLMLERVAAEPQDGVPSVADLVAEPAGGEYRSAGPPGSGAEPASGTQAVPAALLPLHGPRLSLAQLWERSRRIGRPEGPFDDAAEIRGLRDARHGE